MAITAQSIDRDANFVPIQSNESFLSEKAVTYTALGDGAVGALDLFTVTGKVIVNVFAVCDTLLTGAGTVEIGIAGSTASLIAQTTGTDIDADEIWIDNAPAIIEALPAPKLITGTDIIQTIGSDTITAGVINFYCLWRPISQGASVVAA